MLSVSILENGNSFCQSLPDVNEAVSFLLLELLDACNHFVVQPVSVRSSKRSIWSIPAHKLTKHGVIIVIFTENHVNTGISAITRSVQCEGRYSTCKQQLRFSLSSSQELERDPYLLVTAKDKRRI